MHEVVSGPILNRTEGQSNDDVDHLITDNMTASVHNTNTAHVATHLATPLAVTNPLLINTNVNTEENTELQRILCSYAELSSKVMHYINHPTSV